jgi:hypothetical protein
MNLCASAVILVTAKAPKCRAEKVGQTSVPASRGWKEALPAINCGF